MDTAVEASGWRARETCPTALGAPRVTVPIYLGTLQRAEPDPLRHCSNSRGCDQAEVGPQVPADSADRWMKDGPDIGGSRRSGYPDGRVCGRRIRDTGDPPQHSAACSSRSPGANK